MSLTITPHWENPVWYETDVQLALRDLTCKGDVLFDVGANIGGLSSPASRFVGPSGKVVAFEASPRTIATLNNNLALTNCNNVYVEFAAVCDQDDTWLPFYYGHIPNADSLSDCSGGGNAVFVKAITLDRYCKDNNLEPNLIKMDIEGAELLALKGFENYIDKKFPLFILEISNAGAEADTWLRAKGYNTVNLSSYKSFEPEENSNGHSNVLYVHPHSTRGGSYLNCEVSLLKTCEVNKFIQNGKNDYTFLLGELDSGRYIIEIETTEYARSEAGEFEISIGVPNQLLTLHIAPMNFLAVKHWRLPIHIDRPCDAYVIMKRLSEAVLKKCIRRIEIFRVLPPMQRWL